MAPLRFSLDGSLGRLARWLRLLGHDAAWQPGDTLGVALIRARTEHRALLTRSGDLRRLGLQWPAHGGLVVASERVDEQLLELARRWPIFSQAHPFSRCSVCDTPLVPLAPEEALPCVPGFVAATQRSFQVCPECRRIFWRATHTDRILGRLSRLASEAGQALPQRDERKEEGAGPDAADPTPPQR